MPDPRETLARIRAQADAATGGPWYYQCGEDTPTERMDAGVCNADGEWVTSDVSDDNAEFIAAARTTVPALTGALEAMLDLADELDRDGNAFMSDADPGRAKAAYAHAFLIRAAVATALEGENR